MLIIILYQILVLIALQYVHYCCGNHLSQGQMISLTSKPQRKYDVGIHKRTRQGVSAKLSSYIYLIHLVRAITSYPPHFLLKVTMLYTYALTSSSRSFYHLLGLMTSHHVTCHVTAMSRASSSSKIKIKRKQNSYKVRK